MGRGEKDWDSSRERALPWWFCGGESDVEGVKKKLVLVKATTREGGRSENGCF